KFKEDLGIWSIECNVPQTTLSKLLVILQKHTDYPFPKDARSLLKTPRNTKLNPREIEYHHFVNIDGLPISKSGVSSLWFILSSSTVVKSVYIVGAFYGETKSENNIFLEKFVNEAIYLINNSLFCDLRYLDNLYSSPCTSSTFNIQIVKIEDQLQIWPCDKLQAKMWIMSLNKNYIVFPIIHT
ncbi:hypothetical protein ALC57_00627, partial [Trachymyrmex cornetzi]